MANVYILNKIQMQVLYENEVYTKILFCLHRIREHIEDKAKLPILIFPEGRKQLHRFFCPAHFTLNAVCHIQSL